jgi:hypothetical protein
MSAQPQNYKNHFRWFPPYHFVLLPVLLANVINEGRHLVLGPSGHALWSVVMAAALLAMAVLGRVQTLAVQDRVIRLEMRERFARVLPQEMRAEARGLSRSQLVALRFAGDAELPDLVRDVLAGNLPTQKAIKLRIRDWQADDLRA